MKVQFRLLVKGMTLNTVSESRTYDSKSKSMQLLAFFLQLFCGNPKYSRDAVNAWAERWAEVRGFSSGLRGAVIAWAER